MAQPRMTHGNTRAASYVAFDSRLKCPHALTRPQLRLPVRIPELDQADVVRQSHVWSPRRRLWVCETRISWLDRGFHCPVPDAIKDERAARPA